MDRDDILQTIRQNVPEFKPLTESLKGEEHNCVEVLIETFKETLKQVGAEWIELNKKEEIAPFIAEHYPDALDFSKNEVWEEYSAYCSKEKLNQVRTVMLDGQFGVSENGAIWLDDSNFPNRMLPFISEQLIVVLSKDNIVRNMHRAYERVNLEDSGFGVFISGPSKTADIEQSLVYGAHGAKKLIVILF